MSSHGGAGCEVVRPRFYLGLLDRIGHLLPPAAFSLVTADVPIHDRGKYTWARCCIGLLVAVFSASVGVSAIQDTLNTVYRRA